MGVGYNRNSVYIRDSSGGDTRYLNWGRAVRRGRIQWLGCWGCVELPLTGYVPVSRAFASHSPEARLGHKTLALCRRQKCSGGGRTTSPARTLGV